MESGRHSSHYCRGKFSVSYPLPSSKLLFVGPQLPHRPNPTIPRGGANTSDHVDILGSTGLNEIILKVATGAGAEIEDSFVSNIREYSRKIKWD